MQNNIFIRFATKRCTRYRVAHARTLLVGVVYHPTSRRKTDQQHCSFQQLSAQRPHNIAAMAPRNALANISFTVYSASEDDLTHDELNAMPTPDSNNENKAPARKGRGKAAQQTKATSTTKATAKGRPATRVTDTKTTTKKAPAKPGRKAAERKNGADSDAEEADELDEDDITEAAEPAKPAKRGRPPKAKKAQEEEEPAEEEPAPAKRGRKAVAAKEPVAKKEPKPKTTAKSRNAKRGAESEAEPEAFTIPETQAEPEDDPMDIEDSVEVEEIPESMPPPPRPSARPSARRTAASRTRQPSAGARRAGSVSDTERDPAMRRKVGDLTKKLEAMTAKYETLKDVATSGKESNFEQLRKRTEQVAKGLSSCPSTLNTTTNLVLRPRCRHQSLETTSRRAAIPHL
jgi:hypothetical protein